MSAIKPGAGDSGDKELGPVGVRSSIGHGELSGLSVLESKVFIGELGAIDAHATSAIAAGKVATLAHKLWDDTVEFGAFVADVLLSSAKSSKVLCKFDSNGVRIYIYTYILWEGETAAKRATVESGLGCISM